MYGDNMRTLQLGGICTDFSCAKCCKDTKMMLSQKDIDEITKLGYDKNDFCILVDGFYQLKNIDDQCYFLQNNQCQIYSHRPQGCRYYPIIFDIEFNKAILDDLCPLIGSINEKTVSNFSNELRKFANKLLRENKERD
ncbi:MAG: YkgJ family cysteine cluster protein [Asgard group archaeon]|nr:YkgJ family cysteine cluster protein [Asgard group archaeon]